MSLILFISVHLEDRERDLKIKLMCNIERDRLGGSEMGQYGSRTCSLWGIGISDVEVWGMCYLDHPNKAKLTLATFLC